MGLSATLIALLLLPAAGAQERLERLSGTRPNVVVLMTDDQTLESMRVMPRTRRLLGGAGTTFDNSFVSFPLCCPSRATFLTGQYAHNHGVVGNRPPNGGYTKLDTANWLPGWLQRAGYRTIHLGKFLNGYGSDNDDPTEVPPGWTEWYGSVDPSTYSFYGYTLNENGRLVTYGADLDPAAYQTDLYARRASEVIARVAPDAQPFFLSVGFLAPHAGGGTEEADDPERLPTPEPAPRHRNRFASEPLPAPASFDERDVLDKPPAIQSRPPLAPARIGAVREGYQQRLESLLAVDEAVARIVDALGRAGELGKTLVIFTSDNGYLHGEHRVPSGKLLPYEPSIRVPLIMRGPGVPRAERRDQLVSNADLAPTIQDAAGAKAGLVQDGRSLFGPLEHPDRELGRDLLLEGTQHTRGFSGLRTRRHAYFEHSTGARELYDLRDDPDQLHSLHLDRRHARILEVLARRLALLRACSGRSCDRR